MTYASSHDETLSPLPRMLQRISSEFDKTWKKIKRQSERQLGAYIIEYFFKNDETSPLLSQEQTKYRNKAVHIGAIPTREKAITFGNSVASVIRPVLSNLREICKDAVITVDDNRFEDLKNEKADQISTVLKQSVHLIVGAPYQTDIPDKKIEEKIQLFIN